MDEQGVSYTSAPLAQPMKLIGYPVARLTVSSDSPDADLFVYLDLVKDGEKGDVIAFGRIKLSHHKLAQAPYEALGLPWHSGLAADVDPPAPGEAVPVSLALTPISRVIPQGARLRLTITGADPRQRNIKEIAIHPAPKITVQHGGFDASRIELPLAQ